MDWTDEPATESQLSHLRRFGYQPQHPLTKGEAAHLIRGFGEHPEREQASAGNVVREITKRQAHLLRQAVEETRRVLSKAAEDQVEKLQHSLALATAKRQQFWLDTCRDPRQMQDHSAQVLDLYMKYGCRFIAPSCEQV